MLPSVDRKRRWLYLIAVAAVFTLVSWTGWQSYSDPEFASRITPIKLPKLVRTKTPQETLFEQVFSIDEPAPYDYPLLTEVCNANPATEDAPYLNCTGMWLGLTSAMSQVRVCLKMTIDTGSHLVLPSILMRDPAALSDFHSENPENYYPYDDWFDVGHLKNVMAQACPNTRIIHPYDIGQSVKVKASTRLLVREDMWYHKLAPYFWSGHSYREWFADRYRNAQAELSEEQKHGDGITIVEADAEFMLFNIMEDPTRKALKLWNDLVRILRFKQPQRQVVDRLLHSIQRPYYAVHYRSEQDNVWSSPENQLHRSLEWLDKAWERFGNPTATTKPLVYVSTGDEAQGDIYVTEAAKHGWEAIHKWALLKDDPVSTDIVNAMAFDHMAAIDLGIMTKADFFLGLDGSAFSFTTANYRDKTGHYRGSSFEVVDDEGARNHLFHDGENPTYPCCL